MSSVSSLAFVVTSSVHVPFFVATKQGSNLCVPPFFPLSLPSPETRGERQRERGGGRGGGEGGIP